MTVGDSVPRWTANRTKQPQRDARERLDGLVRTYIRDLEKFPPMTSFILALALPPVTIPQVLSLEFPKDRLLAVRLPKASDGHEAFESKASLMGKFELVGRFEGDRISGYVWDSSKLLPNLYLSEADRQQLSAIKGLGQLASLLGAGAEGLVPPAAQRVPTDADGIEMSSIPLRGADYVQLAVPGAAKLDHFDRSRLSLTFSSYVTFTSGDGRTESFVLKPAREGGALPRLAKAVHDDGSRRLPKALREALSTVKFVPGASAVPTIHELTERIALASGTRLAADRRVEEDRIFFRLPATFAPNAADAALAIAEAADMYWRKVGSHYMLAVSPGDPRLLSRFKSMATAVSQAESIFSVLSGAGLFPNGMAVRDFLSGSKPLAELDRDAVASLADNVSFLRAGDRERLMNVFGDASFRHGTINLSAIGFATVTSERDRVSLSGIAIHLDGSR